MQPRNRFPFKLDAEISRNWLVFYSIAVVLNIFCLSIGIDAPWEFA